MPLYYRRSGIDIRLRACFQSNVFIPHITGKADIEVGVVTKDIPDNMIAAGNSCKVIREIKDEEIHHYYKDKEFDVDDYVGEEYSWL